MDREDYCHNYFNKLLFVIKNGLYVYVDIWFNDEESLFF